MNLLKTDHCCCCFDLRTGGLILGYLGAFGSIFGLIGAIFSQPDFILPHLAAIAVFSCWLYGIFENKSSWMLIYVALNIIQLIALLLAWIIIIVVLLFFSAKDKVKNGKTYHDHDHDLMLFAAFLFGPLLALEWHFTSVAFSLYRDIKREEHEQLLGTSVLYTPPPTQLYPVIKV